MTVYVFRTYECPHCLERFKHYQSTEESPPNFCPMCGKDVSGKKKPKPIIRPRDRNVSRGIASKSADSVYRGMENASADRMRDAASVLGVSPESLSVMKMTDMKDNMREGDFSQSTSPADATRLTGSAPIATAGGAQQATGFNPNAAAEYAAATSKGPLPHAGNSAREMVNSLHTQRGSRVVAAGRINKK